MAVLRIAWDDQNGRDGQVAAEVTQFRHTGFVVRTDRTLVTQAADTVTADLPDWVALALYEALTDRFRPNEFAPTRDHS